MPSCSKCGKFFLSEGKLRKHFAYAHEISKSQEPSLLRVDGEYLGGHTLYPSRCQISLVVDENEVDEEIRKRAESTNQNFNILKKAFQQNDAYEVIRSKIREEKVLNFLLNCAI